MPISALGSGMATIDIASRQESCVGTDQKFESKIALSSVFCEQSMRFHRVSMCQLMSVDFSKCVWIIGQLSMKKKSCWTGQKVSRFRDRFLRGDFPQKIVKTTMTANRSLEILRFLEYFDVWQLHKCSFYSHLYVHHKHPKHIKVLLFAFLRVIKSSYKIELWKVLCSKILCTSANLS